jgi:hypothetical protein
MNRMEIIARLVNEEDNANGQFIGYEIDRDKWYELLQDIDSRMAIVGLRLAYRPWEAAPRTKF